MASEEAKGAAEYRLVAVFDAAGPAREAASAVRALGVHHEQVVVSDPPEAPPGPAGGAKPDAVTAEMAGTGAILGGVLGTLLGWMVSTGALPLPGVGVVTGAEPLWATLVALLFGAGAGGIVGALLGQRAERRAELRADEATASAEGPVVVRVWAPRLLAEESEITLIAHGALDVDVRPTVSLQREGEEAPGDGTHDKPEVARMADDERGRDREAVTGTEAAIDPETGALGTAGTPVTTGYGVSGSTIGTGSVKGESEHEEGEFAGATPGSAPYELGGRGSTDSPEGRAGTEHGGPVEAKDLPSEGEAGPSEATPSGEGDIYLDAPGYGGETSGERSEIERVEAATERTDYSSSEVETPPSYGKVELASPQESAGTNIPGTEDPRGLGDNTDEPGAMGK